jgi:D-alanyl-D-alanine carboxypeptidase (penicillin-binding protein 5/6)
MLNKCRKSFLINNNSAKNIFLLMLIALINVGLVHAAKPVPAPPEVAAKNYLLVDFSSGNVLAEKNADAKIEPASITKLMTAYVVYKEIDEDRFIA